MFGSPKTLLSAGGGSLGIMGLANWLYKVADISPEISAGIVAMVFALAICLSDETIAIAKRIAYVTPTWAFIMTSTWGSADMGMKAFGPSPAEAVAIEFHLDDVGSVDKILKPPEGYSILWPRKALAQYLPPPATPTPRPFFPPWGQRK